MLHSVGDDFHPFNITVDSFKKFVNKIDKTQVIKAEEWGNTNNFICLTFDDVADSFYYNAYPILKEHQIPFTLFISCSLLDTPHHLTTEQLKEISSCDLCTIGSHGYKHVGYATLSPKGCDEDLRLSKETLRSLTGKNIELYAFPHGTFFMSGFTRKHYVSRYYRYGFSSIPTPITHPSFMHDYFLPRICVSERYINML